MFGIYVKFNKNKLVTVPTIIQISFPSFYSLQFLLSPVGNFLSDP